MDHALIIDMDRLADEIRPVAPEPQPIDYAPPQYREKLPDYVQHSPGVPQIGALSAAAVVRMYEEAAAAIAALGEQEKALVEECERTIAHSNARLEDIMALANQYREEAKRSFGSKASANAASALKASAEGRPGGTECASCPRTVPRSSGDPIGAEAPSSLSPLSGALSFGCLFIDAAKRDIHQQKYPINHRRPLLELGAPGADAVLGPDDLAASSEMMGQLFPDRDHDFQNLRQVAVAEEGVLVHRRPPLGRNPDRVGLAPHFIGLPAIAGARHVVAEHEQRLGRRAQHRARDELRGPKGHEINKAKK